MRSSLKLLTALALAATLLAGCKGGKEEDHSRDEFSATVGLGIYKDGNPVLLQPSERHPADLRQRRNQGRDRETQRHAIVFLRR